MTSLIESDSQRYRLTEEQKEYAVSVLNEHGETSGAKIQELRKWIDAHETLCAPTDDFTIQRFLRVCKYDVEKAKTKMFNYYAQRSNSPDWFSNRDPLLPEVQEILELGVFLPLREVDEEGRLIILLRATIHDPKKHEIAQVLKASLMVLDVALRDHVSASIYGVVAIFDMTGVGLGHGLQMTPNVVRRLVHAWQGCYPVRIKSLNFVNAPIYINVILNIFKSFMNKKLKLRTHVHMGNSNNFFQTEVPQHILPEEYGGTAGSINDLKDYWKKQVEENRAWLSEEEKYRVTT